MNIYVLRSLRACASMEVGLISTCVGLGWANYLNYQVCYRVHFGYGDSAGQFSCLPLLCRASNLKGYRF